MVDTCEEALEAAISHRDLELQARAQLELELIYAATNAPKR